MSAEKVDAATMICSEHQVEACMVCMIDDFWAWSDRKRALRKQLKQERDTPIAERFDLGGEA